MKRYFQAVLLFGFLVSVIFAGEKRPMTLVDILNVPSIGSPAVSPDGAWCLYIRSESDWEKNRRVQHIWRIRIDGTEALQMTNGSGRERDPEWSPDGGKFAFIDKRNDDEHYQIYLINNSGGEARKLTSHATSVSQIEWSPEGKFIYFLATNPKSSEEKNKEKLKDDVYAFEENYHHRHLWKIDVSAGKEFRITGGDFSISSYTLSRDGTKIAFIRGKSPVREDMDHSEIWIMDSNGEHQRRLTFNDIPEYRVRISPDNNYVTFISWANENFEPYYDNNLFLISVREGKTQMLMKDFKYGIQSAEFDKKGRSIYFIANMGVHTELFRYNLKTHKTEQLTGGRHNLKSWDYNPDKNLHVFSIDEPENPGDLWKLSTGKRGKLKKVTHIFDYLSEEFKLPRQEAIRWKGEDGVEVEGLLYYPLNYKKGKRYPLAVFTHGGPRSSDKYGFGRWRLYIPVLTAKGYAVLSPNYRGSTGYGDDFVRDMVGHYYNQAHKDVMAGVDYLIDMGIADSTRLLKGGWSAGGHMTNKIITYTDRFKAASSGAGAVNWISMYAQSDTRIQRTPWFGGTPWQKDAPIDNYWNNSPLKDVWKVKTPTIIFVGEEDPRVPMPQSVELYRALKSNGVPTKLYVAPREYHGWRELRHRLFKMNVELQWFEKYVMGRDYTFEEAPKQGNPGNNSFKCEMLKP